MLDYTKLWDSRYLFGPNPLDPSRSDLIFFWTAAGLVVSAVVAKILVLRQEEESPRRYLLGRLFHLLATIGILMLLWAGFRFENIPWLSTHIVVLGILAVALLWAGFIGSYFFKNFRRQDKLWREEAIKHKYLMKK